MRDPRYLINIAIIALALLVLALAGSAIWRAYSEFQAAQLVLRVTEVTQNILKASGIQARERGLTSLALGAQLKSSDPTFRRIRKLRRSGDVAWQAAVTTARELVPDLPEGSSAFGAAIEAAVVAHQELQLARAKIDRAVKTGGSPIAGRDWFEIATRHISVSARLREALVPRVPLPPTLAWIEQGLKPRLWQAAEHAGWERGTLAFYLAQGSPVPRGVRDELMFHRGILDHQLEQILTERETSRLGPRIREAVEAIEITFSQRLRPMRARVHRAVAGGAYGVDALDWWRSYTRAIDSILELSSLVSQASTDGAAAAMQSATHTLVLYSVVALVAGGLALFSLGKVRYTANALFRQKELAEVTLHSIGDAVITTNAEGRVEYLNPIAEELTGWSAKKAQGQPIGEVFKVINRTTRQPALNPAEVSLRTAEVTDLENDTILIHVSGREIPVGDTGAPIRDREGAIVGAVLVFYDLSDQHPSHQHLLSYHNTHDGLTKLINRREFERRLHELLVRARLDGSAHALCYLDLDQFKIVNDTCGHAAGDQLLRRVAQLLHSRMREIDTLARFGGDEFGLLLQDCSADEAVQIAKELQEAIQDLRFTWHGKVFKVGASVGVASLTAETPSPADALSEADTACFAAKEKGRNRVQVYTRENQELMGRHDQMRSVSRITAALEDDRFELHFQPIVDLRRAREAVFGEILVRMLDTDGGRVLPFEFIPAAERYGLMPAIDRWVIRAALSAVGRHLRESDPASSLKCSINLSGAALEDEDLADFIIHQLQIHAIPTGTILFEVTETTAASSLEQTAYLIAMLRRKGCRFALDDFGSGMSSFGFLRELHVDYLKIDGQLTQGIVDDPVALSMVRAIHEVARTAGIRTVAEHASSPAIVQKLKDIGIDYAQGFALGKPQPLDLFLG